MDAVATTSEHLPSYANVVWRRRFLRDGLLYPIALTVLVKLRYFGTEHIPRTGPVILLMNHIAFIDPVVAGVAVKERWVTPLAKKEVMKLPLLSLLIKMWGVVTVDRFQMDRKALQQTLALLENDHCILIAPEGTRHPEMQALKEGFVYLATKTNAVIVPVALEGTDRFGHNLKRFRRTNVSVIFGKPFRFKTDSKRVPRELQSRMATEAGYQIAQLLEPQRRGIYGNLSEITTDTLEFLP